MTTGVRRGKRAFVRALIFMVSAAFAFQAVPVPAAAADTASLFLSPSSGTFQVDSTFEVSIFLNTQGNSVNTIDLALSYPPDKLQLVSSGTGRSIIGLWTDQPQYNNQTGKLELTGGIPGGVTVERGLVTTMTFRVRAAGSAIVKFDRTSVLLNDGLGTEILTQTQNSIYDLVLPPPAGPVVVSDTHPDQTQWYRAESVNLRWGLEAGADGFSYMVSDSPGDVPDEISEGHHTTLTYNDLGNGRRYFHIRALRGGVWGGTTHYALNIDTTPPADFRIEINPRSRTTRAQPVILFDTTDEHSGTDHYELKIVPLGLGTALPQDEERIFIEAQSPYVPAPLELGGYDVLVRAYDRAGNYREVTERLDIVKALFTYVGPNGLEFSTAYVLPWWLLILLMLLLIAALWVLGRRMHLWHREVDRKRNTRYMPEALTEQMEELQKYRAKYGRLSAVALLMAATLLSALFGTPSAQAQGTADGILDTPLITTVSRGISNQEIFYLGGRTSQAGAEVIVYIQNEQTAETVSETVPSNEDGEWFYRHDSFLQSGRYVLWVQGRDQGQLSPPSPQVIMEVEETAVQLGATRISHATLYLLLFLLTLAAVVALAAYIAYHAAHGRRKHAHMEREIAEAQESLRRGFAVLNRDIQAELDLLRRAKLSQPLSQEQAQKEAQLLLDLQQVEQYLSKEIWDIEHTEQGIR